MIDTHIRHAHDKRRNDRRTFFFSFRYYSTFASVEEETSRMDDSVAVGMSNSHSFELPTSTIEISFVVVMVACSVVEGTALVSYPNTVHIWWPYVQPVRVTSRGRSLRSLVHNFRTPEGLS